ncbi:GlsB/YeaQ/YmgE family stress response membrane protein [Nocardiopsis suaedae]|uniref:GlsB/YeaQ/YmgE family stress response membrane protein n=1 Tax=Nocardiopsis suaedae TaxID=3018444 RepID=A0ABT4TQ90_9ACTN|nr:GlsB/YeaQ/YmgE family stress response membrane protein [Nocardiopsis suaedae]MDA2806404.1 GlsB/YeaQ/YmgE family stress response membrane protein [Nocardiopsis suaedae]
MWITIQTIVVGLIIGALGRMVVPGKQHLSLWITLLLGIIAAFVGGWLASLLSTFWIFVLVAQIVVAAALVYLADGLYARKG